MRAVVPFRNKREIGVIVGVDTPTAGVTPKPVHSLPDGEPVLGPALLELCRWISQYYVVPLGIAIRTVLPNALTSHAAPAPPRKKQRVATLGVEIASLVQRE